MRSIQDNDAVNTIPIGSMIGLADSTGTHEIHDPAQLAQHDQDGQCNTRRILLVEDDQTLAALEAEILTVHGYTVVTRASGECALSVLQHRTPDLVVLDLELIGNLSGWDVLQALRASTTIPVLLTTSSAQAVRTYIHLYAESRLTLDHLPKPYPMQTFLKRIQRML